MIIASIDIGTNTVLMLVAKIGPGNILTPLLNEYRIPRIGQGLQTCGKILSTKIQELLKIIDEYIETAKQYQPDMILLTATNAFRIATNAAEIIAIVNQKFNLPIKVISGEEEALFSYLGVLSGMSFSGECLVIDIGGGSTEILIGNDKSILFQTSYQIGAVSSKEKFLLNDPPLIDQIYEFHSHLDSLFLELQQFDLSDVLAVAISGTPTTLACIKNNIKGYNEEVLEGSFLMIEEVKKFENDLSLLNASQIKLIYGNILNGREDIIYAGTAILSSLMGRLNLNKVTVSSRGIRYGAIINYLINLK